MAAAETSASWPNDVTFGSVVESLGMKLVPKDFSCKNCGELERAKDDLQNQVDKLTTQLKDNFRKLSNSLKISPQPADDDDLLSVEFQNRILVQVEQSMIHLEHLKKVYKAKIEDLVNGKIPQLSIGMLEQSPSPSPSSPPPPPAVTLTSTSAAGKDPVPNKNYGGSTLMNEGSSSTLSSSSANLTEKKAAPPTQLLNSLKSYLQRVPRRLEMASKNCESDPDLQGPPKSSARPAKVTTKRKCGSDMQTLEITEVRRPGGVDMYVDQRPSTSSVVVARPPPVFPVVTPLPLPSTAENQRQGQGRPPSTPPPRTNDNMTLTGSSGTCKDTTSRYSKMAPRSPDITDPFPSQGYRSAKTGALQKPVKKMGSSKFQQMTDKDKLRKSTRVVKKTVRYFEDSEVDLESSSSSSGWPSPKRNCNKKIAIEDNVPRDPTAPVAPVAPPVVDNGGGLHTDGGDGGSTMFLKWARCEYCVFRLETIKQLKDHMENKHGQKSGSLKVVCRRCQLTIDAESSFGNHACRNNHN